MKTDKFKYFTLVLYPDDTNCSNLLDHIVSNYSYRYILHDKDVDENGNLKKPHFHVVWQVPSPRTIESLKKELSVPYLENVRTIKKMLQYLTHANEKDKFHYDISDSIGDLILLDDVNKEISDISLIMNFISSYKGYLSLSILNKFVLDNGIWSSYRHSSYIMIKTLEEHNKMC